MLVWIHGGGFTEEGSRNYDPTRLAANGSVVVTINYRLGALGFLSHPALASYPGGPAGNYGLMDQQAALLWVQRNIAQFGGSPFNVTIAGQSAGGLSVLAQLVSPGAHGLFQRAIVQVPLPPSAELQWWYQYYFATERGRAGYEQYRGDFAKLIWRTASPRWDFDNVTFDRTAAAFDNPDHVDIVIHNYRWRLGLAEGEPEYDEVEARLAAAPTITVPTITLEGDANGAPHLEPNAYAHKFSGKYQHRTVTGGIGHNLPQEAPEAFAQAIVDVDEFQESS